MTTPSTARAGSGIRLRISALAATAILGASVVGVAACSPGERPALLSIATAGTGGVYYVLGGAMADVWSRHLPDHDLVAEVTGGSVENLALLARNEVQVAFSMGTNAYQAYHATGPFAGSEPARVLALIALYPNLLHLVTPEGSGVENLSGLAGRRVSVGAPGSGTEVAARTILEANGLPYENFRPQRLNFNETANALRDGNLDAGFLSAGPPASAIMDLASRRPVRLVAISREQVVRAASADPTLRPAAFAPGTYPGQDGEVVTASTPNLLVVRADAPVGLVYHLVRVVLEHRGELADVHPAARQISAEYTLAASPIPLHPGAVRYLEEGGHAVPEALLPPE